LCFNFTGALLKNIKLKNVITGVNQSDADLKIGNRRREETSTTELPEDNICGAIL
jgi:hypothetical protein